MVTGEIRGVVGSLHGCHRVVDSGSIASQVEGVHVRSAEAFRKAAARQS